MQMAELHVLQLQCVQDVDEDLVWLLNSGTLPALCGVQLSGGRHGGLGIAAHGCHLLSPCLHWTAMDEDWSEHTTCFLPLPERCSYSPK
jgi:hypothetical protein